MSGMRGQGVPTGHSIRDPPREAMQGLATCFVRYSDRRQHQSLEYQTPAAIYCGRGVAHSILASLSFFFVLTMGYTSR
jgi:hypothetical protein